MSIHVSAEKIQELNGFSNFDSPYHPCASHQILAQSDIVWEEMWFEEFQDGHYGGHLGYLNRMILAILSLHNTPMPSIKFQFNPTYG